MTIKIQLSIQEIVEDFYSLGEKEGYLTGLSEGFEISDNDIKSYFDFMVKLGKKYLPKTYESYIKSESDLNNGIKLSKILYDNFKEIFCQLI